MTYHKDFTIPSEIMEQITDEGLGCLPEMIRVMMNAAMKAERQQFIGAKHYERTEDRSGHANGYKDKTLKTRVGDVTLAIPQVREGGFYPEALERGLRSERALLLTLAEMYFHGISTRKIAALFKKLGGSEISSAMVSKAVAELDGILDSWRNGEIGEITYLYLDARYEKVRQDGQVRNAAVLIASGVLPDGHRRILGLSASMSEREVHWRAFLESLMKRNLRGVKLIISDDHPGLKAARLAVFGGISWQRCQFHLQQNAQAFVPRKGLEKEVADDIRTIFTAPDRAIAESYLTRAVQKYSKIASKLAVWMETNIPEGLTVFSFPPAHRRLIRTTNSLERVNREIRRRTRVVSIFPNPESCVRLISAVLMEISDDWESGRVYLNFESQASSGNNLNEFTEI
jgi:putative transposase